MVMTKIEKELKGLTERELMVKILIELKTANLFRMKRETDMDDELFIRSLEKVGKIKDENYRI